MSSSRKNFNPENNSSMGDNSKQNQMVRNAANEVGVSVKELSDLIHREKAFSFEGDFSYDMLLTYAREIKRKKN